MLNLLDYSTSSLAAVNDLLTSRRLLPSFWSQACSSALKLAGLQGLWAVNQLVAKFKACAQLILLSAHVVFGLAG